MVVVEGSREGMWGRVSTLVDLSNAMSYGSVECSVVWILALCFLCVDLLCVGSRS